MSKKNRQENAAPAAAATAGSSRLADYFWANLIFFAFLFVLALVVRKSCESPTDDEPVKRVLSDAFQYLLLLFGGGFLLVTLFDAAYEFFAARSGEEGPGDPAKPADAAPPMTRQLRRSIYASPACFLLAGLLSFESLLGAAAAPTEAPPARSIAPVETPVPSASQAELNKLKQAMDAFSEEQSHRLETQAQTLSRSAQALSEAREALQSLQTGQTRAQSALDGAKQRLEDLGGRLQQMEQVQSKGGAENAARDARLEAAIKAQAELRLQAQEDRDLLKEAFKNLKSTQNALDERTLKLASLTDMLSVMKQDQDRSHEEMVELRQALKALEPKISASPTLEWWDQALRWPYWGAVAVVFSGVAVGLAAR